MSHSSLLAMLVLSVVVSCSCETYCIVPDDATESCEEEQCYTLDQLLDHGFGVDRNLTLYFNPGKYYFLNNEFFVDSYQLLDRGFGSDRNLTLYFNRGKYYFLNNKFLIDSFDNVEMIGSSEDSQVHIYDNGSISVSNVGNLKIEYLNFFGERKNSIDMHYCGRILLSGCTFFHNEINQLDSNDTTVTNCKFNDCVFTSGSHVNSIVSRKPTISFHILNCEFIHGKGISIDRDYALDLYINDSVFIDNQDEYGGVIYIYGKDNNVRRVYISNCTFENNSAKKNGGAIHIQGAANISIVGCTFTGNAAFSGGAVYIEALKPECTTVVKNTLFTSNMGINTFIVLNSGINFENTSFAHNNFFESSSSGWPEILTVMQSPVELRSFSFNQNQGCIFLFGSRVKILGQVTVSGNIGAIRAVQSKITIKNSTAVTTISNNTARSGGGIMLQESELVVHSPIIISENRADSFGGGIYAYQSAIIFKSEQRKGESLIVNNTAGQNGGGVYAVASTVKLSRSYVTIGSNTALHRGGGLYLRENSRIYLLKQEYERERQDIINIQFSVTSNSAKYGGGIFIADNSTTNGGLHCQREELLMSKNDIHASPDCFIQTLQLYTDSYYKLNLTYINTFITNNTANFGSAIFGGLLDRCSVSPLAEVYDELLLNVANKTDISGLQYIEKTVMISNNSSITSDPVQVRFCGEHYSTVITKKKGETFKISVLAIDQFGKPVNATIHSSVVTESGAGHLKKGQTKQRVGDRCTELEYNVFSQDSSARVEFYAEGPCANFGISKQTLSVTFHPCTCPTGFQPSQSPSECKCACDPKLQSHQISNCYQQAGTIQLETNIWIGVADSIMNGTEYIIHDCPFDYCVEKPVNISLNSSQEIDRQCAFNRSGLLCGECEEGLSLVIATSKCRQCSNTYLLLLIPFALAGIALVGFILFFNITIATGTVHGLIFYSNLLPTSYFTNPNALTVFISWVNLNLGIETCFYGGMSSQAKVLLQLVFPAYLFLLMFLIIILSRYSNCFATLLSNRNPVAALCTLIFLSYSKLLQFIIAALQTTVLELPDGLKQRVWLYDANMQYFTRIHTPRFVAAVLVLTAGGLFTLLLFFAQWFPQCSRWKLMKWTRNTKYTGFMDAYHAPFTPKHRYWVGLLLFALIVHNVLSAMATDDSLPALSIGCTVIALLTLKLYIKEIYRDWIGDYLETAFLVNLIFLAVGTLYTENLEAKYVLTTQVLANISMSLSVCLFAGIICYHSYKHVYLQSGLYRRHGVCFKRIATIIKEKLRYYPQTQDEENLVIDREGPLETCYNTLNSSLDCQREPDLEALAPITSDDYRPPASSHKPSTEVTFAVVETSQ